MTTPTVPLYAAPYDYAAAASPPPVAPPTATATGRGGAGWRNLLALAVLLVALAAGVAGGVAGARLFPAASTSTVAQVVSGQTTALSPSVTDLQQAVESVVQTVQPSVVEVTSQSARAEAVGSGVIVTSDGYIVTNDHVVQGFSSYTVTLSNGQKLSARIVGQDPQDDLAVLKVQATNLRPMTLGNSSQAKVGQFVIALGSPLGLEQSATFGIVSALNRTASEAPDGPATQLTGLIQTSAPINPGNSGGALVDLQGNLIGIPTLGATNNENGTAASGIGFAIPSDRVKFVVDQLIKNGKLTTTGQGYLGIQARDVTPSVAASNGLQADSGVLVAGFSNDATGNSPAQRAGIQTGDVIVAINGQAISDSEDLAGALLNRSPGTTITITVQRGSQKQDTQVTLGERPVSTSQG